jgi:hypothetical protein
MTNQQLLEQAGAQIGGLAKAAGIRPIAMAVDLAGVGAEMLPSLLGHELVAGHAAMMRLMGKLDLFLEQIAADRPAAEQDRACKQACQLSAAAARLTERYRLGLMSLARLQRWPGSGAARRPTRSDRAADPADEFDDDPLGDGPDGGPGGGGRRKSTADMLAELAALEKSMDAMLHKAQANGAKPNGHDTGAQAQPAPDRACPPERLSAPRRGRLRHGNPSGDFLAAPRCGAKTRAGCVCRQPAMANGRCRLHGGKSTGARTAAGLARCRTATLVHGHRTAEIIDLKSAAARHGRNLRTLTRAALRLASPAPANGQSERPTSPARRGLGEGGCPATSAACITASTKATTDEHGYALMNTDGVRAIRRHGLAASAFIPSYLRLILSAARSARRRASVAKPSPTAASNPRSEQPTPCPATTEAHDPLFTSSRGRWTSAPAIRPAAVLSMAANRSGWEPDRDDRRRYRIAAAA